MTIVSVQQLMSDSFITKYNFMHKLKLWNKFLSENLSLRLVSIWDILMAHIILTNETWEDLFILRNNDTICLAQFTLAISLPSEVYNHISTDRNN